MKKYIVCFMAALLLTTSCESWLEEKQFDKINSETLYDSQAGLEVALNGLYSLTRRFFRFRDSDSQGIYWFYCADDLGLVRTYNENSIYRTGMRADAMPTDMWNRPYQMIDRASAIITYAPDIEMTEEVRNRIVAEAKVIRAWSYLRLYTTYDNILLDSTATTPQNAFDPVEYKPADPADLYKFAASDLDFAIRHLDYSVAPGIIGQGLARHLRAEWAMLEGDYVTAAEQCDELIGNGQHTLVGISDVFGDNLNHKETLFAFQFDEMTGGSETLSGGDGHVYGACFQARFYEIKIAGDAVMPILEDVRYGGNSYGWTYPNEYLRSLYDEEKDKRMEYYFYPDTLMGTNPASQYYEKKLPGDPPYSTQFREYAWSVMKYRDLEKRPATAISYKPLVAYRLAETYLLGAEAHWRNGDTEKALKYLNAVRNRAGLGDTDQVDLQAIMDEHARELCFEGKRWFFLKRIGKLVEQVNRYHQYGSTLTSIEAFPMQEHHVRWPIPQIQISNMGTFPQNPEY